jgi:hypothetical protein
MNTPNVSTLAWFAAMAPAETPAWFNFIDPHDIPKGLGVDEALALDANWHRVSKGAQNEIRQWLDGADWDLEDDVLAEIGSAARERMDQRREEIQRTRDANEAARFYAWRWAYAQQMVRGLEASEANLAAANMLPGSPAC